MTYETQCEEFYALLRNDFVSFTQKVFQTTCPGTLYLYNWHILAMAYALEACMRGKIKRLVITIPPRYMKSICASVALPAFLLGRNPAERIICASYAADLAIKYSADCQMVMTSDWYQKVFPVTADSLKKTTQTELVTAHNGNRFATSVGGSITGFGGNWLIIDDPHKADEVNSDTKRNAVIEWFESTAATRLDDPKKSVIILIQQRLHQEDLAGSQLDKGGWYHLNLPAIAEEDAKIPIGEGEFYTRVSGEILHKERHSHEDLMQMKHDMGEYPFAAQYQQRPSPVGGGIIKLDWFDTYYKLKHYMHAENIVQCWDTATTAGEYSNYSVCITCYCMEGKLYLADLHRAKYEFPQLRNKIFELAKKFKATHVVLESCGAGQALVQQVKHEINHMPSKPFILQWWNPQLDKASRLMAVSPEIEAGRVILPHKADWLESFRQELLNFPNGKFDDQVDSLTLLLNWDRYKYKPKSKSLFTGH